MMAPRALPLKPWRCGRAALRALAAWALGLICLVWVSNQSAATPEVLRQAYDNWIRNLTLTADSQDRSKESWAEYLAQVAALKTALSKSQTSWSDADKAQNAELLGQLEQEQGPVLPSNEYRDSAVKLVLKGRWGLAAREIENIPESNRVLLDQIIAGYGQLVKKEWWQSWSSLHKVNAACFVGSLHQACKRLASANPGNPHAQFLLADSYLRLGRPDLVGAVLVSLEGTNSPEPLAGYLRAITFIRCGDLNSAKRALEAPLARSPNDVMANWILAWDSVASEQCTAAKIQLTAVLNGDKTFFPAYHLRGLAAFRQGDYQSALQDLDAALKLAPEYLPAKGARALVLKSKSEAAVAGLQSTNLAPKGTFAVDIRNARDLTYATPAERDQWFQTASPSEKVDMYKSLQSASSFNRFWQNITVSGGASIGKGVQAGVTVGNSPSTTRDNADLQDQLKDRIRPTIESYKPAGAIGSSGDPMDDRASAAWDPNLAAYDPALAFDFFLVTSPTPR